MKGLKWKDGKNCAVAVTVNLNGEYFWLSMFPDCKNKPKTLSLGTFGLNVGLERVLELFDKYGIKSTFFVPGAIAEKYRDKVEDIHNRGHEIANHGYAHENFALLTKKEQEEILLRSNEVIKGITGSAPAGFRAPEGEITGETYELLEAMGFLYDSSLMDDNVPYYLKLKGTEYNMVQLPIQWQLYDFPYFAFNYSPAFPAGQGRIAPYSNVLNNWIYEYEGYRSKGCAYILQIDPQTIGTPGRILMLRRLLEHIIKSEDAWICTCEEMLHYYKDNYKEGC